MATMQRGGNGEARQRLGGGSLRKRPRDVEPDLNAELKVWADLLWHQCRFAASADLEQRGPREISGAHQIAIYVLDAQAGVLRRRAIAGKGPDRAASILPVQGQSLVSRSARDRRVLKMPENGGRSGDSRVPSAGRTQIAVPLIHKGQVLGVASVVSPPRKDSGIRIIEFAESHARKIALAIERRRRLRDLRNTEARYRSIFECGNVCIATISSKGHICSANPAFADLLGHGEEAIGGRNLMDFVAAQDAQPVLEGLNQARGARAGSSTLECRLLQHSGRVVWVMLTVSPLTCQEERLSDLLIVVHDIHDRKRVDMERARMQERLA